MDFVDLLWLDFTDQTPTFKDLYDDLFIYLEWSAQARSREIIKKHLGHYKFFLDNPDPFTQKVMIPHEKDLLLWVVWLWAEDVMWWWRCAHGLSNPLKVYLTLLDEWSYDLVVDGVAWVDMINFWLYHACDYLITVVEPSRNSLKVAKQIKNLCDMSDINYGFVINKRQENERTQKIYDQFGNKVLWKIPFDDGIFAYKYDQINDQIKTTIQKIYTHAVNYQWFSLVERIMKLENLKG